MQFIQFCYPTLAVATVYVFWNSHHRSRVNRFRRLHERVAFMLWSSAHCLRYHYGAKVWRYHEIA